MNKDYGYHVHDPSEFVSREEMHLLDESKLSDAIRDELQNIRAGVGYKMLVADNPQNREAIQFRATYFQMVAYTEGWTFNPELYQVIFTTDNDFFGDGERRAVLHRESGQREGRAWRRSEDVSPVGPYRVMSEDETDRTDRLIKSRFASSAAERAKLRWGIE